MKDTQLYQRILGLSSPWFVSRVEVDDGGLRVNCWLEHYECERFCCPQCGAELRVYDHGEERTWRHLDTCEYRTYLHARLPRVRCPEHGVKTVQALWASEGGRITTRMECRAIDVLQECDVTSGRELTGLDWHTLWRVLQLAVRRGQTRMGPRVPSLMGVDEKSFGKHHDYVTVVSDLEAGTIVYVAEGRRQASLEEYLGQFTPEQLSTIKAIAIDMWDPYVAALRKYVPFADQKIVYDRYHIMAMMNKAVDTVRKQEHRTLQGEGNDSLKGTKYLWLWSEENIPDWRRPQFEDLKRKDLRVGRAWSIKENLRNLWGYRAPGWARRFFNAWYFWATHSRLKPVIKVAKTLKGRIENILSYVVHGITNATTEGLNSKIETLKRMASGFRNREHYKTVIYFHCSGLDLYPAFR